jgi:hypothetical protein
MTQWDNFDLSYYFNGLGALEMSPTRLSVFSNFDTVESLDRKAGPIRWPCPFTGAELGLSPQAIKQLTGTRRTYGTDRTRFRASDFL